jgi:hypothetical protein
MMGAPTRSLFFEATTVSTGESTNPGLITLTLISDLHWMSATVLAAGQIHDRATRQVSMQHRLDPWLDVAQ